MNVKNYASELLAQIRTRGPLVHNITNFVVMNSSANILLALGAAPVMAHSIREVEDMTSIADALVLNIGTIQENWIQPMILAAKKANERGVPVVLDPVGSGATAFRTETVKRIMSEAKISILRGNASEVFSLDSEGVKTRGVDSSLALNEAVSNAARNMASREGCVIAISGAEDFITDGTREYRVRNGHPLMTRVTGLGCGLSAVVGAFCAVGKGDMTASTAAAFGVYGLCGEIAVKISDKPAGFQNAFIDTLYSVDDKDIQAGLRVAEKI